MKEDDRQPFLSISTNQSNKDDNESNKQVWKDMYVICIIIYLRQNSLVYS
jgi:hypothetical protein